MRKMMTKEVTTTNVKVTKIEVVDGQPALVEMEPIKLLGNVDAERAQKLVSKKHGAGVTVLAVDAETQTYEYPVAEFIKIATLKVDSEPEQKSAE